MRVRELELRWRPHPSGATYDQTQLSTPRAAASLLIPMLELQPQEVFVVLMLNAKHKLIGTHEVGRGGLSSCDVDPRIVYRAALLVSATSIIVSHNHPSGDPTPSQEDISCTAILAQAGTILGVELLDHLIIGEQRYFSFREMGRL